MQSRARSVQEAHSLGQAAQVVVSAAASAVTFAIAYQVGNQLKQCYGFWHSAYSLPPAPLTAPPKCPLSSIINSCHVNNFDERIVLGETL